MDQEPPANEKNDPDTDPHNQHARSRTIEAPQASIGVGDDTNKNAREQANPADTSSLSKRFLRDIEISDWITAMATLAIAIMTAFYVIYSRGQLQAMQATLTEMKRNGQSATNQMWSAVENMNWMANSMDVSSKQALRSVDAAIDGMRTDQRAWISVIGIGGNTELELGKSMNSGLGIANTGRTPALRLRIRDNVKTLLNRDHPNFIDLQSSTNEATVAPGRMLPLILDADRSHPVDQHIFTDVVVRRIAKIFIYGRVDYDDVFGFHHWTEFCNVYDIDFKGMKFCDTGLGHNGIDKELR